MVGEEDVINGVIYATGLLLFIYLAIRVTWKFLMGSIDLHYATRKWMEEGINKARSDWGKRIKR